MTNLRKSVLVAAAVLGISTNPVEAYPAQTTRVMAVIVVRSDQPEKLLCTVSQTLPPVGASGILVRIKVPRDSTLKSVLLKTASGELPLEVTGSIPLAGEYETIIDNQKTNCATSGTLFVDVEGTLEAKRATCSGILLPGPGASQSCGDGHLLDDLSGLGREFIGVDGGRVLGAEPEVGMRFSCDKVDGLAWGRVHS